MQVCSREEADAALECIKQKLLEKGMSEEAAEQSLSLEVVLHYMYAGCIPLYHKAVTHVCRLLVLSSCCRVTHWLHFIGCIFSIICQMTVSCNPC